MPLAIGVCPILLDGLTNKASPLSQCEEEGPKKKCLLKKMKLKRKLKKRKIRELKK
jgi:hypothetical protein